MPNKNAGKKVLITGGAGFIGAHLSKRMLDEGWQVVIVDNLNDYYDPKLKKDRLKYFLSDYDYDLEKIDIGDFKALEKVFKKHKFDLICHLAAQAGVRYSFVNPWVYLHSNIDGLVNLLELARHQEIKKIIIASSASVYGGVGELPFRETQKLDKPLSLYGATKHSAELIAHCYHYLYGFKMTLLRFFSAYGPWGRPDAAYFKFTKAILENKEIDVYNFGEMKRDITYIDDVINGVMAAVEKDFDFEIINLSGNRMEELEVIIGLLEKYTGKKFIKNYLPLQKADIVEAEADNSKARQLLGYNPQTTIEQGLKNFVEWYTKYTSGGFK